MEERFAKTVNTDTEGYTQYMKMKLDNYYTQLERASTLEDVFKAQGKVAVIKDFLRLVDKD